MAPAFDSQNSNKRKLKFELKKFFILLLLFTALFSLSYYIVNLLDIKPKVQNSDLIAVSSSNIGSQDEMLRQRLGGLEAGFAGYGDWAKVNNISPTDQYDADPDQDNLPNYLEYIHGTDPNNPDTDGDKFTDMQEIKNGYDPDAAGDVMTDVFVKIDKIAVNAPMVWSKTDVEENMLKDLESGIAHFVGTASPGQRGNSIISGHSSNYIWAKGDYNYVFKNLGDLEEGDMITVDTIQRNGRIISYKYKVTEKYVAKPDEERIFADSENPTMTLSTCWPLGSNFKRLIVKAELIQQ